MIAGALTPDGGGVDQRQREDGLLRAASARPAGRTSPSSSRSSATSARIHGPAQEPARRVSVLGRRDRQRFACSQAAKSRLVMAACCSIRRTSRARRADEPPRPRDEEVMTALGQFDGTMIFVSTACSCAGSAIACWSSAASRASTRSRTPTGGHPSIRRAQRRGAGAAVGSSMGV